MDQFFDLQELNKGISGTAKLLTELYTKEDSLVAPEVQHGFLRKTLPALAPQKSHSIQELLTLTREVLYPGLMNWQSRRFFGYYPATVAMTNVLASMYLDAFHFPMSSYAQSPAHTELENIVVDWTAQALGLPQIFLLKNVGGGLIYSTISESILASVQAAKYHKIKELGLEGNDPKVLTLVGYYTEFCHASSMKALILKDIYHKRAIPCKYSEDLRNLEIDLKALEEMLEKDVAEGLTPFWFGGSYGSTFCGSVDLSEQLVLICKKYGMWLSLDAAYLGASWLLEQFRPFFGLLERVNSISINFSKQMLCGTNSCLLFLADKKGFAQAMGATTLCTIKNSFSQEEDIVDYKDFTFGSERRSSALKFYYIYEYYGLNKLREGLREIRSKACYFMKLIQDHSDQFFLFSETFGLITFQVRGKDGKPSNALTKQVGLQVKNVMEGFSTPAEFKEHYILRMVIGNFNTQTADIDVYFKKILTVTRQLRGKP